MRFWDSYAIVPLLVRQPATKVLEGLLNADSAMLVWWGTPVECVSALARIEREQALPPKDIEIALKRLHALAQSWHEIQAHPKVRSTAERLLRVHPLRAADALQLAAALETIATTEMAFVCLDKRLGDAAAREGLTVIDEGTAARLQ